MESEFITTKLTAFEALKLNKSPYLIIMAGDDIAHRYALDQPQFIIGRIPGSDIILNDRKVSRRHARLLVTNTVDIEDLQSTNGTYVNNEQISKARLLDGDLITIGKTVLKFSYHSQVDDAFHDEMSESARNDALTGLVNRRYFTKHLESECARIHRYGGTVSLLIGDLDGFKSINDRFGHQVGDLALRVVGEAIQSCIRQNIDVAGRYGGEEFAILLPDTDPQAALVVAEKIRTAIASLDVSYEDGALPVTMSIGVASTGPQINSPNELLRHADHNLYQAKRAGKNQVVG